MHILLSWKSPMSWGAFPCKLHAAILNPRLRPPPRRFARLDALRHVPMECVDRFGCRQLARRSDLDFMQRLLRAGAQDRRNPRVAAGLDDGLRADHAAAFGNDEHLHWKVPTSRLYLIEATPLLVTTTV